MFAKLAAPKGGIIFLLFLLALAYAYYWIEGLVSWPQVEISTGASNLLYGILFLGVFAYMFGMPWACYNIITGLLSQKRESALFIVLNLIHLLSCLCFFVLQNEDLETGMGQAFTAYILILGVVNYILQICSCD